MKPAPFLGDWACLGDVRDRTALALCGLRSGSLWCVLHLPSIASVNLWVVATRDVGSFGSRPPVVTICVLATRASSFSGLGQWKCLAFCMQVAFHQAVPACRNSSLRWLARRHTT